MHMRSNTLLFISCACLAAQPGRQVIRNLAITPTVEGERETIHLRNEYSSPATAWVLQCETPQGGSRYYWKDQDLSLQTQPLAPGQEIEFKVPQVPSRMTQQMAAGGTCTDSHPIAAVFADGTVSGDLRWINAIVADRRQAYQDIAKAAKMLDTAISAGTGTAALIQQITDWGKGETPMGRPVRPSATSGSRFGTQSEGAAPPLLRVSGSPVPGAALWLVDTQAQKLPDAVNALAEWSGRLAKLSPVTETGATSPSQNRRLPAGMLQLNSGAELLGKPAPDFDLRDVDGRAITLASLRGKPVLLDFWATWCAPCRESMPRVQALHDQFKDKGLVVLGIDTTESAEEARKYFADQRLTFVNLLGSGSDAVDNYGAHSIPRLVLIGKDGLVSFVHAGWDSGVDLASEVKKLIEP